MIFKDTGTKSKLRDSTGLSCFLCGICSSHLEHRCCRRCSGQGTQGWVLALLLSAALLPWHTAHSSRTQVLSLQNVISRPISPYTFHLSIFTTNYKAGSSHGYRNWGLERIINSDHIESGRARTWTQDCLTWKDTWTRSDIPVSLCPELGKVILEMDSKVIISTMHSEQEEKTKPIWWLLTKDQQRVGHDLSTDQQQEQQDNRQDVMCRCCFDLYFSDGYWFCSSGFLQHKWEVTRLKGTLFVISFPLWT